MTKKEIGADFVFYTMPRNIRVLGSLARGEADCESKLDLLVEFLPAQPIS